MRNIRLIKIFLMAALVVPAKAAYADEALILQQIDRLAKQMNDMKGQMSQMQQTIDAQHFQIVNLEKQMAAPLVIRGDGAGGSNQDFSNNLRASIGEADKWLKGLKFSGDLKLRYEAQGSNKGSGIRDKNRFRFRLRFGFEKTFSDEMKAGFRITTGSRQYNPTSTTAGSVDTIGQITTTNQTMNDNFDLKAANIDRAYATYLPNWAKVGPVEKFEMTAGKFGNPFEEGSSMMIWDRDVVPEGVYEKLDGKIFGSDRLDLGGMLTAGQLVLQESSNAGGDAELFAIQGGLKPKINLPGMERPIEAKNLMSWYYFDNMTKSGNYMSAGYNPLQGNDLAAGNFKVLEIYNEMSTEIPKWKIPKLTLFHDWSKNLDDGALTKMTGGGQDMAWSSGIKIGELKKKGSWEAAYEYYWIEANATPSVFVDADLGGTNRQGSVFRLFYAFSDYMNAGTSLFLVDRLLQSDTNWGTNQERETWQLDMNWKF
jgi:hypothetical protein